VIHLSRKGSDFLKHLNSQSRSKKLAHSHQIKNDPPILRDSRNNLNNIYTVEIKKEEAHIEITGRKKYAFSEKKLELQKQGKIITIKENDKVVKKVKTTKEVIEDLEEKIKNETEFELKLQDINEEKIKKELNKIIQQDKEKIKGINDEIAKIKDETTKHKLTTEIQNLESKVKILKHQIDEIKNHYIIISEYYDFKGYENLKNEILLTSIEDYCFYQEESQIETIIRKCKEEGKKINKIIESYENCLKTEDKVLEIKDYTQKRDEDYKEHNNKIDLANKSYQKITENFNAQDEFIKNLSTDLYYLEEKIERKRIFLQSKSLFNNLLNMGFSLTLLPIFPNIKMFIQLILLKKSIEATHNFLNPQIETTFTNAIIKQYLNIILDKTKILEETEKMLKEANNNLKSLKNDYIDKFSPYKDIYSEYKIYLNKIEKMEEELNEKQKQVLENKQALEQQKNKVKELRRE